MEIEWKSSGKFLLETFQINSGEIIKFNPLKPNKLMHKKLIIRAFEKASEKLHKRGIKTPSLQVRAEEISNFGAENRLFTLGERRLRDYFNEAQNVLGTEEDIKINQGDVIGGLCAFLGYGNYQEFLNDLSILDTAQKVNKNRPSKKSLGVLIALILLISISVVVYFSVDHQRWMIWQDDHYVEVEFDQEKMRQGLLKLYKEDRIQHFKKIIPNCSTEFFKIDGSENLWYGKNEKGELEYFTDLAQHPETGKSLDPMTNYMIKKHVCETY